MFILQLNDMRSANVENIMPVARAETKEALKAYLEQEKVDQYLDGNWHKAYRKGGPLEWFNPPWPLDNHIVDVGSADDWAANARRDFEERILVLVEV